MSKIYFGGKYHKAIYYGGKYHSAAYYGSTKVWSKSGGGTTPTPPTNIYANRLADIHVWISSSNKLVSDSNDYTSVIPCEVNTTYTITMFCGYYATAGITNVEKPANGTAITSYIAKDGAQATRTFDITTSSDTKYIILWYFENNQNYSGKTKEQVQATISIVKKG